MIAHLGDLRWMLPPLAMCLVLMGIHGYLGLHVLSRKVIFVDLALAQIAALGSVYAVLLGFDPRAAGDATVVALYSLGFTFAGAAVFSLTRMRHERVPQEAFIGIIYATASATALLLLARASGEAEHIKEMLVGNILLVTWPAVAEMAALYAVLGAFHYAFRRPFLEISADPEAAVAKGRWVRLWDFMFYASFGLVITRSVSVAGVLLVFSFLVVPAVVAFMFATTIGARVVVAWIVGTACSAGGMLLSFSGDLPTGPSVVVCFAGLLVLAALGHYLSRAPDRGRAAGRVLVGSAVVAAVLALTVQGRRGPVEHAPPGEPFEHLAAGLASPDEDTQIEAVHHLAAGKDPRALGPLLGALEKAGSERVAEHIVQALPEFGEAARTAVPALTALARRLTDPFLRLEVARALLGLKDAAGFQVITAILEADPPAVVEGEVGGLLKEMAGSDFGIGRGASEAERGQARERFRKWLDRKAGRLRWRADLRRFE